MKPSVSPEAKKKILTLRHSHSLAEVAKLTGLPVGTVKTICSRSGAFRDNMTHRALFSLPPIKVSQQTALVVPELPPKQDVTGDKEVDAVLWLRQVIKTGQADLIEKAMEGAKKIKTPLKELQERYTQHLVSKNPGNWTIVFQTFGFGDLEDLAESSIKHLARRNEAQARFGDAIFSDTDAESFCISALAGLTAGGDFGEYDEDKAAARFKAHPEVMPNTISDCMHELSFWRDLYWLRHAATPDGQYASENHPEVSARDDFVFRCLGCIRPRNKDEAITVLRFLADEDRMNSKGTNDILSNLIR
jgi:hypothetical protein